MVKSMSVFVKNSVSRKSIRQVKLPSVTTVTAIFLKIRLRPLFAGDVALKKRIAVLIVLRMAPLCVKNVMNVLML